MDLDQAAAEVLSEMNERESMSFRTHNHAAPADVRSGLDRFILQWFTHLPSGPLVAALLVRLRSLLSSHAAETEIGSAARRLAHELECSFYEPAAEARSDPSSGAVLAASGRWMTFERHAEMGALLKALRFPLRDQTELAQRLDRLRDAMSSDADAVFGECRTARLYHGPL